MTGPQQQQTGVPQSSFDRVLAALQRASLEIRKQGRHDVMATCPVHEDGTPSLHVQWFAGPSATVLYCFGCTAPSNEIAAALGLTLADLYDAPLPPGRRRTDRASKDQSQRRGGKRRGKLGPLPALLQPRDSAPVGEYQHAWVEVERYPYCDVDGTLVQEVIRESCECDGSTHKRFRQVFINGQGRSVKTKPPGFKAVLYRAPELRTAVAQGVDVWLLEGEKDVHSAETLGLVATTNTQGGKSFPDHLINQFRGAVVNVVLDRDTTGWARGADLHDKLTAVGATVTLLLPAVLTPKADFTDHLEAGKTVGDLIRVQVDEVRTWLALSAVESKAQQVRTACVEAQARWALHQSGDDPQTNARYAQRWVFEAQIRHEELQLLAQAVWNHGMAASTPWAGEALNESHSILEDATLETRRCHLEVGVALPPALADTPVRPPVDNPDTTPAEGESDGPRRAVGGAALAAKPMFQIKEGQIWHYSPGRGHNDEGSWKVVLNTVVKVRAFYYTLADRPEPTDRHFSAANRDDDDLCGALPGADDQHVQPDRTLLRVRLEYADPNTGEPMCVEVGADQWRDHTYLERLPSMVATTEGGFEPLDYNHGRSGKDVVRRAIIAVSTPEDAVVYNHIGLVQSPLNPELDAYVTARGVLTAEGMMKANVAVSGSLAQYNWPNPTQDPGTHGAIFTDVIQDYLRRFPTRVVVPLFGHLFRGLLGPTEYAMILLGDPATKKTGMAALGMHFYGELHDRTSPFISATQHGDTANAMAFKMSKVVCGTIHADDFNKDEGTDPVVKRLDATLRLAANQTKRDRLDRSLQVNAGSRPGCNVLITSEVAPRTESAQQRAFIVPLGADDIDLAHVLRCDAQPVRAAQALFGASLCQWTLQRPRSELITYYRAIADKYRDMIIAEHGHTERRASAMAQMWVGWTMALDWLESIEAIGTEQRNDIEAVIEHALVEAGQLADDPDDNRGVGPRALEVLRYALTSGAVHVVDSRTGDVPPTPYAQMCGWSADDRGSPGLGETRWIRGGKKIGYVRWDPQPERGEPSQQLLILDPEGLKEALEKIGASSRDRLDVDQPTVLRALMEMGAIKTESEKGRKPRQKVRIKFPASPSDGLRYVVLYLDAVFSSPDDDPDDVQDEQPPAQPGPHLLDAPPVQDDADSDNSAGPDQPAQEVNMTAHSTVTAHDQFCGDEPVASRAEEHRGEMLGAPSTPVSPPGSQPRKFRAAAVVADLDTLYLSNGETVAMPGNGPRHIGDLAKLGQWLDLGTQVTKYATESGQVWITEALARHMGFDVDAIVAAGLEDKDQAVMNTTAGSELVTAALGEGWTIGGQAGDRLRRWTRVWQGKTKSVWLVLIPGIAGDQAVQLLDGDPSPGQLAERIGRFASTLGMPFHLSGASTGLDLMKVLRRKDQDRVFAVQDPCPPALLNVEEDTNWCRQPTQEESAHEWVHAYDRSGSYLAGVSGLALGIGQPRHVESPVDYAPRVPGYWLITVPEPADWRAPHPLDPRGRNAGRQRWVTTPSLDFARELGYDPEILEGWVWDEHSRVLDSWYERLRDARTALDVDDPANQAARNQLKLVYSSAIGMLGSEQYMRGKSGYAPDWRHMIVSKSRTNISRRIHKIGLATGRWPVAVTADTVLYTSPDPDPAAAWPGGDEWLGRQLGRYKPEGSALLADHLQYLTGGRYSGKDALMGRE